MKNTFIVRSGLENKKILRSVALAILLALLAAFQLLGLKQVPFHPDESTQLYMSGDFEAWRTNPRSLAWSLYYEDDLKQRYRELDAPLTRYILGLGRVLAGLQAPETDWDWGVNWEENRQSGALPTEDLLHAGRLAVAILLPISLLLTYFTANRLGGSSSGLLAMLLLGTNALVLLHARRAMAEGALLFGGVLFLWSLPKADRHPWLAGLSAAAAFNAKQSALALFPAGLLAACWLTHSARPKAGRIGWNAVQYSISFVLLTLALNPLLWSNPIQAVRASWQARQELLHRQVSEVGEVAPEQVLQSPGERFAVMLANLYVLPPAFAEIGNYRKETTAAEAAYLAFPGNNLLRGVVGGGVLLFLTLCGLILAITHLIRAESLQRRELILIMVANMFQAGFLLVAVPLPWQRYILPLIPFVCIWSAYGLSNLLHAVLFKKLQWASRLSR